MMTVRELRELLNDDALNQDALVLLCERGGALRPLDAYGEKRYGTAGRHTGALVPYDEATDTYDEAEGDDSMAVLVLWSQE
jgi:hypothetical protein